MAVEAPHIEQAIRDYLPDVRHMSLATAGLDGEPWISELDFVYTPDLTLCFRSLVRSDHGQDITENPHVAGNMVRQYRVGEAIAGVSFKGTATILGPGEAQDAFAKLFEARLGASPDIVARAANPDDSQFYQVNVTDWFYYGALEGGKARKYSIPWSGR